MWHCCTPDYTKSASIMAGTITGSAQQAQEAQQAQQAGEAR